jgi:hypothetical protein
MAAELIQICYDDSQRAACYPFAKVYFNEGLSIFFESEIISELVSTTQASKIAVCSWKLKEKQRYNVGYTVKPREITQEVLESDYDILSFTKNTRHHRMLAAANNWHKGFRETMKEILDNLQIHCPFEVKTPIYQNAFSASRETYQDYVKRYLKPAMELMATDKRINYLVMQDSNYATLDRTTPEKLDRLEKLIGIRYYPLSPFLLERLFSIYVHNHKLKVTDL